MALIDIAPSFITRLFHETATVESEVEYIAAGDEVAVRCSDFPDVVTKGFVVRWSDTQDEMALIHVWYWDAWANGGAGEYRQLFTWEHIDYFRRLDCHLADGHSVQTAIINK